MKELKKDIQKRVLQNGQELHIDKFKWDEGTKTFSSLENNLVLDFGELTNCTFIVRHGCTIKSYDGCTFKTGYGCNFDTGYGCTFDTGADCNFYTSSDCTFNTASGSTFRTGERCVIVKRDIFEVIMPEYNEMIMLNPDDIKGFISSKNRDKFYLNRDKSMGEHIIADGILSKVISRKDSIMKVIIHGSTEESFIIEQNGIYSHGKTIEEARESLSNKQQ